MLRHEPLQGTGTMVCHGMGWACGSRGCHYPGLQGGICQMSTQELHRMAQGFPMWHPLAISAPLKGTAHSLWVASLSEGHMACCGYPQQSWEGTSAESRSHTSFFNRIQGSCKCEMKEAAAEREGGREDCTGLLFSKGVARSGQRVTLGDDPNPPGLSVHVCACVWSSSHSDPWAVQGNLRCLIHSREGQPRFSCWMMLG